MSRATNKAGRILEIESLLIEHPEGLNQTEIAKRLGVDRSTISRNLKDTQAPISEANGLLYLDRRAYLLNLRFSVYEALSIHLAARLLANNLDRQNAHAASALRKISQALCRLAPQLSRHIAGSADVIDNLSSYDNPTYMRVLETLTDGWAAGCKVKVWHRKSPASPLTSYVLSPYYIEPGAWGRATYVIGYREPPGTIRTFKIERIEQAELLKEHYSISPDFNPFELLSDAWGIWYTEEEPVEVRLRFNARVAARVHETHWHHSQQEFPRPDGSLELRIKVASVREMLPWIRGWGADVEVLEPVEVRDEMRSVMRAAAENYGWVVSEPAKSMDETEIA